MEQIHKSSDTVSLVSLGVCKFTMNIGVRCTMDSEVMVLLPEYKTSKLLLYEVQHFDN